MTNQIAQLDKHEAELKELALRIRGYQLQRRWSDEGTRRALPLIGSTKTYKKILTDDFSEMDLEKQLVNYRSVWESVKALSGDNDPEEVLFEEVYATAALSEAFLDVMETTSIARVIILQGPTASGKSAARRMLMRQHGHRLLLIEASVVWKDRPLSMLGAMLEALGHVTFPQGEDGRFKMVTEALREKRRGVIIEEAQHLGPRCLNMLKSLVNVTPGEFILITIDTLFRRLETAAYEECRQISSNRLFRRINLGSEVRESDARVILQKRLRLSEEEAMEATAALLPHCRTFGRLAFLRGVCSKALDLADGSKITKEVLELATRQEIKNR